MGFQIISLILLSVIKISLQQVPLPVPAPVLAPLLMMPPNQTASPPTGPLTSPLPTTTINELSTISSIQQNSSPDTTNPSQFQSTTRRSIYQDHQNRKRKNDTGHIMEHVHGPLAKALNVIFSWADEHFPLTVRILQVAKTMSNTKLKQIPGSKMLIEILAEATHWHILKDKLEVGTDFSNYSIEKVIDEFADHHNYTMKEVPMLKDLGEQVVNIPAIQDLAKGAMLLNLDGTPFALALIYLIRHIGSQIPVSQLTNVTVLHELRKNITNRIFSPIWKIQVNKTITRLKNHTHIVISNWTEFSEDQVQKVGQVALNITDNLFLNTRNISNNAFDYTSSTMNRTKILSDIAHNLTREQIEDLNSFLKTLQRLPGKFFESPTDGVSNFTKKSMKFGLDSFERLTNFSEWLNKLTWSHLQDIGGMAERARDLQLNNAKQGVHLGRGIAKHVYHSVKNFSELTAYMKPVRALGYRDYQDMLIPKSRNSKRDRFLSNIPIISSLPGFKVIQWIFNRFPDFKLLE